MSVNASLLRRFGRELVPTIGQVLLVVATSAALIVVWRIPPLLRVFGITSDGMAAAGQSFRQQFDSVISSAVAGNVVLLIFWSFVGIIVYLVCWFLYGVLVAARNEVAIKVSYVNSGKWQGPWATLGVKGLSSLGLIVLLVLFIPGHTLWQLMAGPFFDEPNLISASALAGAIMGLSLQLYLILVAAQLTFTPWFYEEAFTD